MTTQFEVSIANRLHYIVKPNLMDDQMAEKSTKLAELDPVWHSLIAEGKKVVEREPLMGSLVHSSVLHHDTLEKTLA